MTREKEGTFDDDPKPRTKGHNEKKRELFTYLRTVEECLLLRDEHNNIMIKMKKSENDLVVSSYETVLAYGFPLPRKEATIDHHVFLYTVVYYY